MNEKAIIHCPICGVECDQVEIRSSVTEVVTTVFSPCGHVREQTLT